MTNQNDFLPTDYTAPKPSGHYMKLADGENRFRILSKPIIGWLDWQDKKPLRFRMDAKPNPVDPKKAVRHFWAFIVWNVNEKKMQILEITQSTIQSAIQALSKDEDWGSPFGYDIKIKRSGTDLETKYAVSPVPHSKLSDEAKEATKDMDKVNLEALYEGGDPFESMTAFKAATQDVPF